MALPRAVIASLSLTVGLLAHGADETTAALPQRIKAALLYKFTSYVQWPDRMFHAPDSPIVIGVSGSDGVAAELERAVAGRRVGDRPVSIRRLAPGALPNACCHVLFVGNGAQQAGELLEHVGGNAVLTVTEAIGALPKGSVINFLEVDDRIRFDISRETAERNGLQLRSQLLAVARQVVAP
jgi:hypothetical protein